MSVVAVIGLGAMGSRIAGRLLGAGHDVIVWNRTVAKADPLVEQGARRAESPADAARQAEVVLLMVSDPAALLDVVRGDDGVAAAAGSATVVQMSTVDPKAVSELAGALPEGTPVLDAPVLGSLTEVESGTLQVFVSGPRDLADRWTPLFRTLGTPRYLGPLGAGTKAKLVANTTLLGTLSLLGETLALARSLGLPSDITFEVLSTTPLAAVAARRREAVLSGEYPLRFALELAYKDAGLVVGAAEAAGAELRLAAAARAWLADAVEDGLGERDYSSLAGYIADHDKTA